MQNYTPSFLEYQRPYMSSSELQDRHHHEDNCELAVCGLCGARFDCETEYQREAFSET
jgi:hypothetical protein